MTATHRTAALPNFLRHAAAVLLWCAAAVGLWGPAAAVADAVAAEKTPSAAAVAPAHAASATDAAAASSATDAAAAVSPSDGGSATDAPAEVSTTFEVSGLVGWHHYGANSSLGRMADRQGDPIAAALQFGARLGVMLTHHWLVEAEFDLSTTGLVSGRSAMTVIGLRPHVVFDLLLGDIRPFLLAGPALVVASPSNPLMAQSDVQVAGEVGGGLKVNLAEWWGLRGDARAQVQQGFSGPAVEWAGTLSLFGRFPAPPRPVVIEPGHAVDSDGDGLADPLDRCPKEAGVIELYGCPQQDRDGDGVLDADDKCPRAAGPADRNGCPPGDSDGDGLKDDQDDCPKAAGPAANRGCPLPDRDGDGVPDAEDLCPALAGRYSLQGCPRSDLDGDGVLDHLDKCPEQAGVEKYKGCPPTDTDKDGLVDWDDKCPDKPGPAETQGCPINDRDGDGVADSADKCPKVKGVARFKGCPAPDKDADGVPDDEDKCPSTKGVAEEAGCPLVDTDKDGVPDRFDKCPDQSAKSSKRGDGCPDEVPVEVREFFGVVGAIDFEPGSAVLADRSLPTLDKAADLIRKYTGFRVEIAGHTDNTGSAPLNRRISASRAQAVRKYLVEHAVDGKRLTAAGYGPDKPIADNDTLEGRRANRRVEFKLLSE